MMLSRYPPTVLVVEDHANRRAVAGRAFEALGCLVLDAPDGAAGLARLRAHPEIVLLFMDLHMPGIGGLELAGQARRLRPDLTIVLTALEPAAEPLPDDLIFVPKPWRLAELEALVAPLRRGCAGVGRGDR